MYKEFMDSIKCEDDYCVKDYLKNKLQRRELVDKIFFPALKI